LEEPVLRHFLRRISSTGTRDISRKNETEDGEYFEETDVNKTEVQAEKSTSSLAWWFYVIIAVVALLLIMICCKCLIDDRDRQDGFLHGVEFQAGRRIRG
jgi:hypothetical protein